MNKLFGVMLGLCGCTLALAAQTTMNLDDAVKSALAHNLSLRASVIDLNALKRSADSAWNGFVPSLNAQASASASNATLAKDGLNYSLTGTLAWSLDASVFTALTTTRLNFQAGVISYHAAVRAMERDVRKAYYQILLYQEKVTIARQNLATAQNEYDQTLAAFQAGMKSDLDVKTALVSLDSLKPDLDTAILNQDSALYEFKQLLGLDTSQDLTLSDTLALATTGLAPTISEIGDLSSTTLDSLRKNLEQAQAAQTTALANLASPSLSLSWSVSPTLGSATGADMGGLQVALGYSISKLIPGSSAWLGISSADDKVQKLNLQIANQKASDQLAMHKLVMNYNNYQKILQALTANIQLAQRSYDLCLEAYKLGSKSKLELQAAQDKLVSAEQRVLESSYNLLACCLDLEYLTGLKYASVGRS